jgi:hypothetical protein
MPHWLEACASSHHWSRELKALGHTVRLMPPAYVKRPSSDRRTMLLTPRRSVQAAEPARLDGSGSGRLIDRPGGGKYVGCLPAVSDNGTEFISNAILGLGKRSSSGMALHRTGRPIQNGYIVSFDGRMRDELLNQRLFIDLDQSGQLIGARANDYNTARPHSSLGCKTLAAHAGTLVSSAVELAARSPARRRSRSIHEYAGRAEWLRYYCIDQP